MQQWYTCPDIKLLCDILGLRAQNPGANRLQNPQQQPAKQTLSIDSQDPQALGSHSTQDCQDSLALLKSTPFVAPPVYFYTTQHHPQDKHHGLHPTHCIHSTQVQPGPWLLCAQPGWRRHQEAQAAGGIAFLGLSCKDLVMLGPAEHGLPRCRWTALSPHAAPWTRTWPGTT